MHNATGSPLPKTPTIDQALAIESTEGPLLIIAGPGSGKTSTLVERTIHLIAEKNVAPETILISTFTEKAAKELISRITNRLLELDIRVNINDMYIGTLHSIFLKIIKDNREYSRLPKNLRMLDLFDQTYFIYQNIAQFTNIENSTELLGPHTMSRWQKATRIAELVPKVAEELINPDDLLASPEFKVRLLGQIYKTYEAMLNDLQALDFSHIQVETWRLLNDNPDLLKKLQENIQYLMIDEYQDTNTIQERILLKLLPEDRKNICVVGDDDQSLYRFRGATVRNILEFEKNFQPPFKCQVIKLTTNFRSHPDIIEFYNNWMDLYTWSDGQTTFRFLKTIEPQQKEFPSIPSVFKISATGDPTNWHNTILEFILYLQDHKKLTDINQITFLFRSVKHQSVKELANFFESNGIQVFSPRSDLFFERDEIKLMLGALATMMPNLHENLKWNSTADLDIWNYYRQCSNEFAAAIQSDKTKHGPLLTYVKEKIRLHANLVKSTDYAFSGLFYQLLNFPMFSELLDVDLNGNVFTTRAAYNLGLLSKFLVKFEYLNGITLFTKKNYIPVLRRFFNQYLKFLHDGGIEEYEDFNETVPSGCISFMTIHQAKGLEFPIVFVDSLNAVPRKQFKDLDEILQNDFHKKPPFEPIESTKFFDFYRLYYTAYSRAQNVLILTAAERSGRGKTPSKYFDPVYRELPVWSPELFDIQKLDLDEHKPTNIKNEYSFTSHMLLYENCPRQYKFFKELEFSPIRYGGVLFGLLVHQTIEDIHKSILRGQEQDITDNNIQTWFNINYRNLSRVLNFDLNPAQRDNALKQVINYKNRNQHNWLRIKEAEYDVSLVKDDYILKGTIDLIEGDDHSVDIIDFKAGPPKPDVNDPNDRPELDRHRRQLETYAHIVENRTGLKVNKMFLYYTREEDGNPTIAFDNNPSRIDDTIKSFDATVHEIECKNFDITHLKIDERLCKECDMRFYCKFITFV